LVAFASALLVGCLLSNRNLTIDYAKRLSPFDHVMMKAVGSTTMYTPEIFGAQLRDHPNTATEQEYLTWSRAKKRSFQAGSVTCPGWQNYKTYIEELFRLAPTIEDCSSLDSFVERYANASINLPGHIVLRRRATHNNLQGEVNAQPHSHKSRINPNQAFYLARPGLQKLAAGRDSWVKRMWETAHTKRNLPSLQAGTLKSLDLILYPNDKPRVLTGKGLPIFVFSGQFVPGKPDEWHGHLPFPSHLYQRHPPPADVTVDTITPNLAFAEKRPVLFYRGRFSENVWKRADPEGHNNQAIEATPRFQLANASKLKQDRDVLDVQMTGFAVGGPPEHALFRKILAEDYNISVVGKVPGKITDSSQYVLAVSGNGWAGNTMMRSIMSGACTIFIKDTTMDYEGMTRDLGEVYFPLLQPGKHIVEIQDYYELADTIRRLNKDKELVRKIAEAALEFSKQHLGPECALDVIELLVWNYYRYITTGCPAAFTQ
jgi:hypothetical protein